MEEKMGHEMEMAKKEIKKGSEKEKGKETKSSIKF